jgi:uncharacterized protein YeaO (DUF488 family)
MATKRSALRIKRVYDPPARTDGARVLVDRVWPRGMRKEEAALDAWLKDVAPGTALRRWFGHDPERFAEFRRRYRMELSKKGAALDGIRRLLREGPVTLVYGARDTRFNQAVVLQEFLLGKTTGARPRAAGVHRSRGRDRGLRAREGNHTNDSRATR